MAQEILGSGGFHSNTPIPHHLKRKEKPKQPEHMRILRYSLHEDTAPHAYLMAGPCKIVEVALKDKEPQVWVMCSQEKADRIVILQFFPTGAEIPSYMSYIKTIIFDDITRYADTLVYHLCIDTRDWHTPEDRIAH